MDNEILAFAIIGNIFNFIYNIPFVWVVKLGSKNCNQGSKAFTGMPGSRSTEVFRSRLLSGRESLLSKVSALLSSSTQTPSLPD